MELLAILLASWLAGLTAAFGGLLAHFEGTAESEGKRELIHGIIAFGGGILVAAVAFALVPEGMKELSLFPLTALFCAGGIVFCLLDSAITRRTGNLAQFLAMLIDFVPEAMSMGAVFAGNHRLGFLLAFLIAVQNLPEGFNSYREICGPGRPPRQTLLLLLAVSVLGPASACLGYFLLQDQPALTAGIMSFAAGGILYLIFQDIAPQAVMQRRWLPPLGAILGFAVGMVGKTLIE